MSELKQCPFCGGKAVTSTFFDVDDLDYMPIEVNDNDAEVTCENERCINGWWLTQKEWNNRPIEDALHARIAELKGVIEILEDQQREVKNILIDKNLHIDSLYEEGYKLQKRIAELEAEVTKCHELQDSYCDRIAKLEADKERLNSCESALISMVNQFFYSKVCENIFRHSFLSAEEEAAEYLVEHGIARWAGKNKSAICFDEVQE